MTPVYVGSNPTSPVIKKWGVIKYDNQQMTINREELAELCDARDKLCGFCENDEDCEKCQVTRLIDDAYTDCPDIED